MDSRGGCCIARYGGGGYDMSKIYRIMLKFRPIAPKPAASDDSARPSVSATMAEETDSMQSKPCRGKKRYRKNNNLDNNNNIKKNSCRKRKLSEDSPTLTGHETRTETLPLLPSTPKNQNQKRRNGTVWLSFSNNYHAQEMMNPQPQHQQILKRSWVVIECVIDTWLNSDALGCTDNEKMMNLEKDKCPGFVSDGQSRVTWMNPALKKMVGYVMVSLMMMEKVEHLVKMKCPAFTCRVRLQYTCDGKENSITLPCDVWRMSGVRFAWRLDVDAALSLGR